MIEDWLAGLTDREQLAAVLSAFVVVVALASFGLGWSVRDGALGAWIAAVLDELGLAPRPKGRHRRANGRVEP